MAPEFGDRETYPPRLRPLKRDASAGWAADNGKVMGYG